MGSFGKTRPRRRSDPAVASGNPSRSVRMAAAEMGLGGPLKDARAEIKCKRCFQPTFSNGR